MILLLEGTECVGKTTLANAVGDALRVPVIHFSGPPHGNVLEYFSQPIEIALREHRNFVLDRGHLSNRAYNGELGGVVLDDFGWDWIDGLLAREGAELMLLVDSVFSIYARLRVRGDPFLDKLDRPTLARFQDRFQEQLSRTLIQPAGAYCMDMLYDPEKGDFTAAGRAVLQGLREKLR